ncbi:DUF3846 domain-containing protein [Gulosibacter macacae]|nr:DUF3846 domain-containing protein [Gulosibacter macacae]
MVQGIFVPAIEGNVHLRDFASLEDYKVAAGGWKTVDVPDLGITIYVNEEGLVRRLPFNSRASFLCWYHLPQSRKAMLVGDAVIVGMPDENGDSTDVPERVVNLLTDDGEYAILVKVGGSPEPSGGAGCQAFCCRSFMAIRAGASAARVSMAILTRQPGHWS